jgi:hypothetical protein
MNKQQIVMGINARVSAFGDPYNTWKIGLTHNTAEREKYWRDIAQKDIARWTQWAADSLAEAQAIERYFLNDKGMTGGAAVDLYENKPVFVYVF